MDAAAVWFYIFIVSGSSGWLADDYNSLGFDGPYDTKADCIDAASHSLEKKKHIVSYKGGCFQGLPLQGLKKELVK